MPFRLPTDTKGAVTPLLLLALRSAEVGVVVKSSDGRYLYASGLPAYFPAIDVETATDETVFDQDWIGSVAEAQRNVLASGKQSVVELSRTTNSQYCVCECTVQRYEVSDGAPAILMTFVDLTPERKREDTLKALLRELSHRSKNLLAIVQSIASQTARNSDNLYGFLSKFRGRIAALSSAQDLVTDSNWHGALFQELATRQFARYFEVKDPRVVIRGEDVLLSPNGATHVGLALHELITNAVAYGALTNGKGHVDLSCRQVEPGLFEILWDEETGRSADQATKDASGDKRFGSTVLERVVPSALEGSALYTIEPGHVSYRLSFKAA